MAENPLKAMNHIHSGSACLTSEEKAFFVLFNRIESKYMQDFVNSINALVIIIIMPNWAGKKRTELARRQSISSCLLSELKEVFSGSMVHQSRCPVYKRIPRLPRTIPFRAFTEDFL
jgi:hypothetical protein